GASSSEQSGQTEVSIVAARFVVDPVRLVALLRILLLDRPGFRPRGFVFNCDAVLDSVRTGARPSFDQMPVLARSHEVGLGTEVSDINHQCFAIPPAARIAKALQDMARKMRTAVDGDDALPALTLSGVIENRYRFWRLYNSPEAAEVGENCSHAAL